MCIKNLNKQQIAYLSDIDGNSLQALANRKWSMLFVVSTYLPTSLIIEGVKPNILFLL